MRVEVRADSVRIDGYVNAVLRDSRVLNSPMGQFVEQVEAGAFQRAIDATDEVKVLLNHDMSRVLGSTKDTNVRLFEDNIGLRAMCEIADPEVVEKARRGELRGWSFGFIKPKSRIEQRADGIPRRILEQFELVEVSIIDRSKLPCYVGTSIEARADGETMEFRAFDCEVVTIDDTKELTEQRADDQKDDPTVNENYKYENRLRAIEAGL